MKELLPILLALAVIGVLGWNNYNVRGELAATEVTIGDLNETIAGKEREKKRLERDKDREIKKLEDALRVRDEKGYSKEGIAAKDAEIAERDQAIEKAKEIMQQQAEQLKWYKAEMRKVSTALRPTQ